MYSSKMGEPSKRRFPRPGGVVEAVHLGVDAAAHERQHAFGDDFDAFADLIGIFAQCFSRSSWPTE